MKSRKEISSELGMTEQYLSMLINGERNISWPLAERLSAMFPGKSISEWKRSTPKEFERAFAQYQVEEVCK